MLMSLRIRFSSVSFLCAVEEDHRITIIIPIVLSFAFSFLHDTKDSANIWKLENLFVVGAKG
jgi:hypothetical protein